MYISPIGKIGFITNYAYRGDSEYQHTGLFANEQEQINFFNSHSTIYTNYQYNRDRDTFIVGDNIKRLSKYSYMWFDNAPDANEVFESKRYYCFIENIKYINNNATEVTFKVDLLQTFLFEIDIKPCLIEREHSLTDNLYENITPEDISVDEFIVTEEHDFTFSRMMCGVVLNKQLPTKKIGEQDGISYYRNYEASFKPPFSNVDITPEYDDINVCGIPNTFYWYTDIPVSDDDVVYYRENSATYFTQPLHPFKKEGSDYVQVKGTQFDNPRWYTASYLLSLIVGGYTEDPDGEVVLSEDNIVAVYFYPDFASIRTNRLLPTGYKQGIASDTIYINIKNPAFVDYPSMIPFTPKNKKMYNYPFTQVQCFNNQGQSATFKPESFGDNSASFRIIANYTNPAMMVAVPVKHEGDTFDYENSISIAGFPDAFYSGDALVRYLQQNSQKREASLLSACLTTAVGGMATAISKNPLALTSAGGGLVSTYLRQQAEVADLKNTPPQNYASFNTDFLNTAINKVGFTFKLKTLKGQIAKIVDDYFTVYGYKVNKIAKPAVISWLDGGGNFDLVKLRPKFNYIKTSNARASVRQFAEKTMCDSSVLSDISKIFNNGVTFWLDKTDMCDYTVDNSPIVTEEI